MTLKLKQKLRHKRRCQVVGCKKRGGLFVIGTGDGAELVRLCPKHFKEFTIKERR